MPTNFNATAGNAQVVLTWTASGGAAGYIIYRSTASGQEVLYKTVTGTSFTDAGLANGTTYYYKIAAVNSGGASALSGRTPPNRCCEADSGPAASASEGIDGIPSLGSRLVPETMSAAASSENQPAKGVIRYGRYPCGACRPPRDRRRPLPRSDLRFHRHLDASFARRLNSRVFNPSRS